MCGIFGYIGEREAIKTVLSGLKKLEYRGYDSAGLAGLDGQGVHEYKVAGKVADLEAAVDKVSLKLDTTIAHTRWATHGKPTQTNAHPHCDVSRQLALVHNGIVENHESLRKMLKAKGVTFVSETDTEVVAHLVSSFYEGDLLEAVERALPLLQGSFALALIHKDHPGKIVAVAHESPLVIGMGDGESFVSSDVLALKQYAQEVVHLHDSEIAVVEANQLETFDASMKRIIKNRELIASHHEEVSKGDYEHFTLKEIHEQPNTLRSACASRFSSDYGTAILDGLNFDVGELLGVKHILILACGTSWHAGLAAAYMLEDIARIPVQVEISSEYRYKNPIVPSGTFVIAISQSGETADTLAAVRELKAKGAKVLSICNVHGSSLAREAEGTLYLRAGAEIGVCSTKAFSSQVAVLTLLTLQMARMRHMDKQEGRDLIESIQQLPEWVEQVLSHEEHIKEIAGKYAAFDNFFFLGRRYMYPAALEGALKLKEISYINANGYPAGEMKHGPIALIDEICPSVAMCADSVVYGKMLSNLQEVKARNGLVLAIAEEGSEGLEGIANDIIWVPKTPDVLSIIPTSVAAQLLSYYIALARGAEIDQPRNLAKSVTVE